MKCLDYPVPNLILLCVTSIREIVMNVYNCVKNKHEIVMNAYNCVKNIDDCVTL